MTDDKFDPDESHFSDEELEAALAGFEKEFADDSVSGDASDTSDADKTADAASAKSDSDANDDTADKASADSGRPMTDDVTGSVADAVERGHGRWSTPRSASTTNSLDCWVTRRRWR